MPHFNAYGRATAPVTVNNSRFIAPAPARPRREYFTRRIASAPTNSSFWPQFPPASARASSLFSKTRYCDDRIEELLI